MRDLPEKVYIDRGPRGGLMFRDTRMPDTIAVYVPADRIEQLERELAEAVTEKIEWADKWSAEKALADRLLHALDTQVGSPNNLSYEVNSIRAAYRKARGL